MGARYEIGPTSIDILVALLTVVSGLLMVSNFKYHSFKDVDWRGKVNFVVILLIVLVFVVIATEPALVLFILAVVYAASGPIYTIRKSGQLKLKDVLGDNVDDADFEDSADKNEVNEINKK